MKTRRIYLYNPQTSEYSGQMDMQEHPFRPGEYISPEFYTETPPKLQEDTIQLYNKRTDTWDIVQIPVEPLPVIPETDPQLAVEKQVMDILNHSLEEMLDYIANQPNAPRTLRDARSQIIMRRKTI